MAKKKVKMGIVGIGAMGQGHVQAFTANPDSEIVAICDQSKEWGTKYAFTKWEDLVACDAVDAVAYIQRGIACVGRINASWR